MKEGVSRDVVEPKASSQASDEQLGTWGGSFGQVTALGFDIL